MTDKLPWCPNCQVFSPPTDAGRCGDCDQLITWKEGDL